ncbi:hypothetical protein HYC85_032196 [Camellia sinensis]|uniref:Uncharacterized protein n=1 Tax=Camellia sinensis TaxID=4442 RepID=A0A7J7FSG8_CAMSI|nr:hypothetical protein HYC85_032196 [Camellia sinensis]
MGVSLQGKKKSTSFKKSSFKVTSMAQGSGPSPTATASNGSTSKPSLLKKKRNLPGTPGNFRNTPHQPQLCF